EGPTAVDLLLTLTIRHLARAIPNKARQFPPSRVKLSFPHRSYAMVNQCRALSTRTNGPQSRECALLLSGTYGPRYSRARWALLTASCSKPCCCASTYGNSKEPQ